MALSKSEIETTVADGNLEGVHIGLYPNFSCDEAGMNHLFKQFAFPGAYRERSKRGAPSTAESSLDVTGD
ncbi:MAG: hypothetical protein ACM3SP_25685 [Chloroflexota bacterium]